MSIWNMGMPVSTLPIFLQIVFLFGVIGWIAVFLWPSKKRDIFRR